MYKKYKTKTKIAFFLYETRDLNTFPAATNAIRILVKNNYQVDVYVPQIMDTKLNLPGTKIIVISENCPYRYIVNSVNYIEGKRLKYGFIFAFYFEPLIVAYLLNKKRYIPTIYFSMELFYRNYINKLLKSFFSLRSVKIIAIGLLGKLLNQTDIFPSNKFKKRIVRYANNLNRIKYYLFGSYYFIMLQLYGKRFIRFSIIQDEARGKLLRKEFRFIKELIFVPNSYIGYESENSTFTYKFFQIPKDKKIILYTGGLNKGFDLGLLDIADKLGDNYILFLNVYSRDQYIHEAIGKYKEHIESGNIFINQINLDEEEYTLLVRSSYIGIVWSQKLNAKHMDYRGYQNMYYLGYSSGKLMKLLSCGKPVVAPNYFYRYPEIIDGNGIGLTCGSTTEIIEKIEYIEKNYRRFQKNVKSFYLNNLEYEKNFKVVLEKIKKRQSMIIAS